MIPELGHFALILATVLAVVQTVVPLAGAATGRAAWMAVGGPAAVGQLVALAVAFAALTWAYVTSDFSVLNVVQNSHSAKPMLYKVAGVWGNHEGSMLLWVLVLALFGAGVAAAGRGMPMSLRARVVAFQGLVGLGFLTFILATSNPFLRVDPAPLDGLDLNPLLQDPALALHPPFLYLGYVGFSTAFSFALAALVEGRLDAAWARWARPWVLVAWATLTIGIALGSWWAYYELGWGGWWFWDPVENASLLPWLTGTALLHCVAVAEKREALKTWTVLLAIVTFGLSLLGTFLVRSGVLTSVHAFAVDPDRGIFILVLLILAVGGALALYAWRAPRLSSGGGFAPISREGAIVINNLLLCTAAATVLIGTLYPLVLEALDAGQVSVGPPYYNATFVPLAAPLVALVAVGPLLAWRRGDAPAALTRLWAAALLAVAGVGVVALWQSGQPPLALLGIGLGCWAIGGALVELGERVRLFRVPLSDSLRRTGSLPRAAWGMTLAHAGLGIAVLGMTGASVYVQERLVILDVGQTVEIAGYEMTFGGVEPAVGPNYQAERATLVVRTADGDAVTTLHPERRWYPVAQMGTAEAAIRSSGFADLFATLGEQAEDGRWTIRVRHNPLVSWIWAGSTIMGLGGLVSLADRRAWRSLRRRVRPPAAVGAPA